MILSTTKKDHFLPALFQQGMSGYWEVLRFFWVLISLIVQAQCDPIWVFALVSSVIIYDIVHKKWAGGIVIMGLCRFFLWLSAATCLNNSEIAPQTVLWGFVLMSFIIGISFRKKNPSKKSDILKSPLFFCSVPP